MARRRQKQQPEEDFPMTPMIDMVFLLLVFFMTVSTVAKAERAKDVALPSSTTGEVGSQDTKLPRLTLSLDADSQTYLGLNKVGPKQIKEAIKRAVEVDRDLQVKIRADKETEYSAISDLLDLCGELGVANVAYATFESRS